MELIKKYLKISGVLFLALCISTLMVSVVYVSNSPQIKPNLGSQILAKVRLISQPREFLASFFPNTSNGGVANPEKSIEEGFKTLQQVAFTQVAPGVAVRASENVSETSYDLGKIKWIKHTIVVDGVEKTFGWPEGKELPPKEVLEALYK